MERTDAFWFSSLLVTVGVLTATSLTAAATFKIGVLVNNNETLVGLQRVIEYINNQQLVGIGHRLDYIVNVTKGIDTFNNIRSACDQVEHGIVAFVGPLDSAGTKAVAPLSEAFNIPLVAPLSTDPLLGLRDQYPTLIRMVAPDSIQSLALLSLVEYYGWTKMAILTSDTDYGTNGLIKFQAEAEHRKWGVITVLRFQINNLTVNATSQLEAIKETGVRVVVLNCLGYFGHQVLQQAAALGMTNAGWAWLVTDGITTENFNINNGSVPSYLRGLLGTRPVSLRSALWRELIQLWNDNVNDSENTKTRLGYIMDAVLLVSYALADMIQDKGPRSLMADKISCSDQPTEPWLAGTRLLHYMSKVDKEGVSNRITFNSELYPQNPAYDIVSLTERGWLQVGNWSQTSGLRSNRSQIRFMGGLEIVHDFVSSLANRTIRAVAIAEVPFVIIKNDNLDKTNVRVGYDIEGYCIDLLNKLAEMIGFNYTVYFVEDNMFGSKDMKSGQWNGLVKDLMDRKADLALADMTITYAREEVIDFTKPYLDLGLTFLMQAQLQAKPDTFRFLDPFSTDLWIYILVTTGLVAMCVSLVNKISPFDYHGEFIYIDDRAASEQNKSDFKQYKKHKRMKITALAHMNFTNALWFSIGALLQQGGECYPKSISGRITTCLWWFSIMILSATYTANLAAFLTSARQETEINSIDDLVSQTKIEYGTVRGSAPYQQMMTSPLELYQQIGNYMSKRNTLLPNTTVAVEKTRQGGFAFIWESAVLEYIVQRKPCNTIRTVGRLFGNLGYGFGLQKNSPYQEELSTYILHLRETGFMDQLKEKWYKERGECQSTETVSVTEVKTEVGEGKLDIGHMLGVFYIIYGGQLLSVVVLAIEWMVKCASAVDKDDPLSPHTFLESLNRRWEQVKVDWSRMIFAYFLPCKRGAARGDVDKRTMTSKINGDSVRKGDMSEDKSQTAHELPNGVLTTELGRPRSIHWLSRSLFTKGKSSAVRGLGISSVSQVEQDGAKQLRGDIGVNNWTTARTPAYNVNPRRPADNTQPVIDERPEGNQNVHKVASSCARGLSTNTPPSDDPNSKAVSRHLSHFGLGSMFVQASDIQTPDEEGTNNSQTVQRRTSFAAKEKTPSEQGTGNDELDENVPHVISPAQPGEREDSDGTRFGVTTTTYVYNGFKTTGIRPH